jgi:hypothetical protein
VPDEREPLAQLPPDSEHGADAGDEQDQDPDRPNHLALEEQADAEAEQQPVDVVVGVVPPLERVVEVEGVAGDVDQERRRDEREPCPGQAPVVAATAGHQPPDDRWQEHRDRVGDQAGPERLALELRKTADERRDPQLPDGQQQDHQVRRARLPVHLAPPAVDSRAA